MICNKIFEIYKEQKVAIISSIIGLIYITRNLYSYYCIKKNFNRLDRLFPRKTFWEKELNIYSVSLSRFYTVKKKPRCVLLISGYRDIPYLWDKLIKYFESNSIDYYAPRTYGNGRSFFQPNHPTDWIITYLEALKVLEAQYETVDIIAISTGCVIALYLTQSEFYYKCKISNLILCAPFLIEYPDPLKYLIFSSLLGPFLRFIIKLFIPLRIKSLDYYKFCRDTNYDEEGEKDYYDIASSFDLDHKLIEFKKFRPKKITAENIAILYPNDDKVIGSIYEQRNIIQKTWGYPIPIIEIPNYSDKLLPSKCAHVMFKEHPIIVDNIIENIMQFIK